MIKPEEMKKETFDIKKACEAQAKLCREEEYPHFAPFSGTCWDCNRNIYTKIYNERWNTNSGISVEKASTSLITGCPHCHRSYCD